MFGHMRRGTRCAVGSECKKEHDFTALSGNGVYEVAHPQ